MLAVTASHTRCTQRAVAHAIGRGVDKLVAARFTFRRLFLLVIVGIGEVFIALGGHDALALGGGTTLVTNGVYALSPDQDTR